MTDRSAPPRAYQTSLDRAGLALATGGIIGGVVTTALAVAGGTAGPLGIVAALMFGSILSALAIAAVAAPVWVVMHVTNRRSAAHAALVGAAVGFVVFVAGQTYGFGMFDAPPSDWRTLLFRWLSAIATSLLLALLSAGVGVAMWRIAYRPLR